MHGCPRIGQTYLQQLAWQRCNAGQNFISPPLFLCGQNKNSLHNTFTKIWVFLCFYLQFYGINNPQSVCKGTLWLEDYFYTLCDKKYHRRIKHILLELAMSGKNHNPSCYSGQKHCHNGCNGPPKENLTTCVEPLRSKDLRRQETEEEVGVEPVIFKISCE